MKLLEVFGRMPWMDRLFIPVALVLALLRISEGLETGQASALAAGAGFALYAVGKLLQYWYAHDPRVVGLSLKLQMAGIGLWLASMIWRFAA
ncbi:hypothetical protein [Chitinimonas sp. BJB300]|uniref:hypothetical protein n=1 Tax=Chitinimonas sp. BJB300 TaxID=1559339 RepID=UPI000C1205D7|nr:hypothetical protein [Chitinimonas sp. BJB300]PHV12568.1 hypothetical protein CSQ89_05095 [Chitinimonas sp. BJB300]TSJ90038.1 hypothetical protein FG002_007575 [Chitinimonas sp. BJB300]